MGKPTGFIEYTREVATDRPPIERIKDWNEFHEHFPQEKLMLQGARCMDCGVPFCHTGEMISGMAAGCPLHNLVPEWNDLIYRGLWQEALQRLVKTNNFPEFTGRVCPAPCEGSCTLGIHELPVTIKQIECAIVDKAFENSWITPRPPEKRTGKKVAVIGSGPAGLACADQLNQAGHLVTVFERADRAGGLLMYGIPNMKLDKTVVQSRVDLMAQEGVTFIMNTEIGKDIPAEQIRKDFDAIVLCCGATKPRDLAVEGRHLEGIHLAMDFLHANTKNMLEGRDTPISAKDKHVIVIGGGDTGTDCVATSIRHGCKSVQQFEILPRPPKTRAGDNPWPEWPKVYSMDYGQEEAAEIFGDDPRYYCINTQKFVGNENGRVKEIHTIAIQWEKDTNNRFVLKEIPGTSKTWQADLVLLALGFLGPDDTLPEALELARDARSNVQAEFENHTTSAKGIFTAGDMRRGQSLVVWAISEGRYAAKACNRYLGSA